MLFLINFTATPGYWFVNNRDLNLKYLHISPKTISIFFEKHRYTSITKTLTFIKKILLKI